MLYQRRAADLRSENESSFEPMPGGSRDLLALIVYIERIHLAAHGCGCGCLLRTLIGLEVK